MLLDMRMSQRVTVTLPKEIADKLRQRVESGAAESVSGLVAEVLAERFRDENVAAWLADMQADGEPITEEAREWARQVLRSARGE